ncbi:MAG: DUF349 domain-containing protein [Bacteroidales bacterium]|jgi:hypothetical protein|nr:DUF349 domain-containing protein [Bacteroidales bacterium]
MESKDLLHPENGENQIPEVNSGTSQEGHCIADAEQTPVTEQTQIEVEQVVEQVASEVTIPTVEITTPETNLEVSKPSTESISVNQMMDDIEQTQSPEDEEDEEDDSNNQEREILTLEEIEKLYAPLGFDELIKELQNLVSEENINKIKIRVGVLKALVLDKIKELKKQKLDAFIEEGGNKEEFIYEPSELEHHFNKALQIFKSNKNRYVENLEAQKIKNLEAKNSIIDGLRELIENETNLKVLNDKFKEFQEKWREVGPVPQSESTNLWQNYHFQVEKFFDILRINKELRTLDLRKNLELKIKLCETAESLILQESINKSFKQLQQLHDEWKEIGPVPDDKKDEVWERFKNASSQVNQRRREYYDVIFTEQQNNYNAKVVLCEQAEELIATPTNSVKEMNAVSDKLTELLKMWKSLGHAPNKLNDEIWTRFKSVLDSFFQTKKEYFQKIKDVQIQNYNLKLNLAIQAEAIANRTDWKQATDDMIKLQKEWKEIGATPKRHSDAIWKRFRAACDKFFEAKSYYFSNAKSIEAENLAKKEEVIKRILEHQFTEDKNENLEVMKAFQREFLELGHVPIKDKDRVYEEFRSAVNKRFSDLKMSMEDVKKGNFKSKLDHILNNPNADKILDKERRFLSNKLQQLKDDIALWENNLGFFANSKNADLLKAEFEKKIESAKEEVKELQYKIKMMNQPK